MKLTSNTTIHTPDYDLHDWAFEHQSMLDDCKEAYVCDRLDGLKSEISALRVPSVFQLAIENMDSDEIEKLNHWLFKLWQAHNNKAKNINYLVGIISEMINDALLREIDEEVKQQYE